LGQSRKTKVSVKMNGLNSGPNRLGSPEPRLGQAEREGSGWLFDAEERQVSRGVKVGRRQKWNSRVLPVVGYTDYKKVAGLSARSARQKRKAEAQGRLAAFHSLVALSPAHPSLTCPAMLYVILLCSNG
jgi:hypothetical protein